MRAALGGSCGQQEVEAMHHRSISTRPPFWEDLHSAARLIDPTPPITRPSSPSSLFLFSPSGSGVADNSADVSSLQRRAMRLHFFSHLEVLPALLRDVQVLSSVVKQPVTLFTLCLVTSGSVLTGEKG